MPACHYAALTSLPHFRHASICLSIHCQCPFTISGIAILCSYGSLNLLFIEPPRTAIQSFILILAFRSENVSSAHSLLCSIDGYILCHFCNLSLTHLFSCSWHELEWMRIWFHIKVIIFWCITIILELIHIYLIPLALLLMLLLLWFNRRKWFENWCGNEQVTMNKFWGIFQQQQQRPMAIFLNFYDRYRFLKATWMHIASHQQH